MNLRTIIPIKGNLNMSIAGKRLDIAPFLMEVDFPDDGVRTTENILGNLYKAPHEPVDKYYKLMPEYSRTHSVAGRGHDCIRRQGQRPRDHPHSYPS